MAQSIKNIVDCYRNDDLAYVTLVGGDDSIPFFRYPDQALLGPERGLRAAGRRRQRLAGGAAAQLHPRPGRIRRRTLGQRQVTGRSRFPTSPSVAWSRRRPRRSRVIDAYLATTDGVVSSVVVAGDRLRLPHRLRPKQVQGQPRCRHRRYRSDGLIDPADQSPDDPASWTADDLRTELFDMLAEHDLVFLAGHFSANSALAADYQTSVITTELAASTVDYTNSIVFSGGCHSGYNIVNGEIVPGVTLPLDWAQAFAQKGATLIAGTGYQYGDTDFVEYSERLYVNFSEELRTGTGAGVGR